MNLEVLPSESEQRHIGPGLWAAIETEIERQHLLRLTGKFETTCREGDDDHNVKVALEELGEVSRAINDKNEHDLIEELVQNIACYVQWYNAKTNAVRIGLASVTGHIIATQDKSHSPDAALVISNDALRDYAFERRLSLDQLH